MDTIWRVIGGAEKGGLLVRENKSLTSPEVPGRLSTGAYVRELELSDGRLFYKRLFGEGPEKGWVSTTLKDKHLLVPIVSEQDRTALQPQLLEVKLAKKSNSQQQDLSLEQLERYTERQVKLAQAGGQEETNLKDAIRDLIFVAMDRKVRKRVVCFIANLLQRAVESDWDVASACIVPFLCVMSWASSFTDIEYTSLSIVGGPLVLVAGFGGSHVDDLRPAMEHWATHYGADVLCWGPTLLGRREQITTVCDKVLDLLKPGQPVILHFCSDGGFASFRNLLQIWYERFVNHTAMVSPADAIRCAVADGASLGRGDYGFTRDGIPHAAAESFGASTTVDSEAQSKDGSSEANQAGTRAAGRPKKDPPFFMESGLRMLLYFGACEASFEEPAVSFCKATMKNDKHLDNWKNLETDLFDMLPPFFSEVEHIFLGLPVLVIGSTGDAIIPLRRSLFTADFFKKLPGRSAALAERWCCSSSKSDALAEDGLGVHTLVLDKIPHCKGFMHDAARYWSVTDHFVEASLQLQPR